MKSLESTAGLLGALPASETLGKTGLTGSQSLYVVGGGTGF